MLLKILKKPLTVILLIFILLGGSGLIVYYVVSSNYEMRSYEIISYNNLYSLRVPVDWEKSSGASQNAVIAAESPSGSVYAMMSADSSYESGFTMEEYINSYIDKIAQSSDDPLVQTVTVKPEQRTMGENSGYYFELDTIAGGVTVHTWDFVFTGDDCYVHVDVVSSGEDNSSMKDTALEIINSAHVI